MGFNIKEILGQLKPFLDHTHCIFVAYSGGLDSTVLLHLLSNASLNVPIRAIHINHNLSVHAGAWQQHCVEQCVAWGVPILIDKVNIVLAGKGLEEAARSARYAVFKQHITQGTALVTAHHGNDQAETLLFRLARGTGVHGMGGIRYSREFESGIMIRPLLGESRQSIYDYAKANELTWINDESNSDEAFDRNYIRHKVLPYIEERWPQAIEQFKKVAQISNETCLLLDEYVQNDLALCAIEQERLGSSLSLEALMALSERRKNHVLRHWIKISGFKAPSSAVFKQIDHVISAAIDASPVLRWGACELRRFNQRLFLLPQLPTQLPLSETSFVAWDVTATPLDLGGGFFLRCCSNNAMQSVEPQTYRISFRQGDQRCKPAGRQHSQRLKKLFQEYALEPWLRDRAPLIYSGESLVAVADLWVCADFDNKKNHTFTWFYQAS